jgi:hypothetical protein
MLNRLAPAALLTAALAATMGLTAPALLTNSTTIPIIAAAGWDVSTALHQKAGAIRARLAELVERLDGAATSVDIPPYVEWAQSPAAVFISVKWELGKAPATLGCAPSPPAVNGSAVVFRAVCALKRKTFAFAATLFAPLDAERCTFADASVGRATLTLAKAESDAVGETVGGWLAEGEGEGSRVGVKEGEPRGCVHAIVTCPWPPAKPAPGT